VLSLRGSRQIVEEYPLSVTKAVEKHRTNDCISDGHGGALHAAYLIPTTIESGPTRCSTRVSLKPISFIQPMQSAPV
jgi:hypothetical protein